MKRPSCTGPELVATLRPPLVTHLVDAERARAKEEGVSRRLGEHLERLAQGTRRSAGT